MSNHEREGLRSPNSAAALNRAWRQASDGQPSPQLDAAIITAARKSVQDSVEQPRVVAVRSRSRSWLTRWQPLAAAAAVAGLAFVLVQSLPRERDVAPSIRMKQPAQVPATTQETLRSPSSRTAADETTAASPPAQADAQEAVTATASARAKAAVPAPGMTVPSPVAPQTPASTAADTNERDTAAGADGAYAVRAMDAEQRNAATSKMAAGVASAGVAAAAVQESRQVIPAPRSAADPAANIAALYAAGDVTRAANALRAFRGADPDADARLPESLRDWARTVQ